MNHANIQPIRSASIARSRNLPDSPQNGSVKFVASRIDEATFAREPGETLPEISLLFPCAGQSSNQKKQGF
jgi:hypothetical protein